jgi:glycosyltransferase involved in cell wall biosynthesis
MSNRILIIESLVYKKNKAFGYQEYLFNLLDFFFENRTKLTYDEVIIVCDLTQKNDFEKYNERLIVKGYKTRSIFSRFVVQFFLPFLLKLKRTDAILYTGNYSSFIKKSKQVLVVHDLLYLRKQFLPDILIRLQRRVFVPRSIAISDKVIAISDFTRNDILKNIKSSSENRIVRVYNYFNFQKYTNSSTVSLEHNYTKYFLCVSSAAFHKNVIIILKAFEKFCVHNDDVDLFLVGSINYGSTLAFYNQLTVKLKDRIHLFYSVSNLELSHLYADCEAFISASLFEGLGMPIVEAMYFNVPLILSDIDVFREVTNNQAVFFNPNSIEELSQILIKNKYRRFGTQAFVLEKYSSENTSQKYIDILNSL